MNFRLLDCTLRDGGYYTNWDFDSKIVDAYIDAMNQLPIDYLEVGYRNNPEKAYLGKFGYTPAAVLKHMRETCAKKLVVMLNEKSTKVDDLEFLLKPILGLADMVRIAIDPKNFDRAVILAKAVKAMGFEVGFNVMYMSKWSEMGDLLSKLRVLDDFCDLFCMVDSFGGVTPEEVTNIYKTVKANTKVPVGFHGHNNLQLGLINTLTAISLGIDYVDATIFGMGRGAGNLNMELLLTYLNKHNGLDVDFNVLGEVISAFTPLHEKYQWGTNLPYMLAGANKIPQKEVMEMVTNRVYSFNSIVRSLQNKKDSVVDNAKFEILPERKYDTVVIIGGGSSPIEHLEGIKSYIESHKSIALVFATARHAQVFNNIEADKYYCLVGREAKRLAANVPNTQFKGTCVLPPYPRKMGTEVPEFAIKSTYELAKIEFINEYMDSCTTIAIQLALEISCGNIYVVGYDGYSGQVLSEKEMSLTHENVTILQAFESSVGHKMKSLTPTLYPELEVESLYQFI